MPLHRPTISGFTGGVSTASLREAVDSIGSVNAPAVAAASEVIRSIPNDLLDAAHATWSARLVVLGILMAPSAKERQRQLNLIESTLEPGHESYLQIMEGKIKSLHPFQKLPLLDLCIPSLAGMSRQQYDAFMKIVQDVIKADGQITLLEWTVYTVLEKHLGERFDAASRKQPGTKSIRSLSDDVRQVLATAAYLGQDSLGDVRAAYESSLSVLKLDGPLPEEKHCTLRTLRNALTRLGTLRYADRQKLLKAIGVCIDMTSYDDRGSPTASRHRRLVVVRCHQSCPSRQRRGRTRVQHRPSCNVLKFSQPSSVTATMSSIRTPPTSRP